MHLPPQSSIRPKKRPPLKKRTIAGIVAFVALWGALRVATALADRSFPAPRPLPTAVAHTARGELSLAVENTPSEKARGLMGKPKLPRGQAMYFPLHSPEVPQLWMKDVPFPIDIVFIRDGRVAEVLPSVPPCGDALFCPTYSPTAPVDAVIEFGAGEARRLGLTVGTPIAIQTNTSANTIASPTLRGEAVVKGTP